MLFFLRQFSGWTSVSISSQVGTSETLLCMYAVKNDFFRGSRILVSEKNVHVNKSVQNRGPSEKVRYVYWRIVWLTKALYYISVINMLIGLLPKSSESCSVKNTGNSANHVWYPAAENITDTPPIKCSCEVLFTRARGWASPWHEMKSTLKTGLASHLSLFYQSESTSFWEFPWLLTEFWFPVSHLLLPRTKVWQLRKSCKHFPFLRGKKGKFNIFSEKVITVVQTCVGKHEEER